MPYKNINELPESVKNSLPKKAQEIYMKAFNSADRQYGDEKTAHRVAWSAVKREYAKKSGKWIKK